MRTLADALLWSVIFGLLGIALTFLGYKVFDWLTPGIRVEHELAEKHNIAVAIVVAAVIVGVAIVVAAAIS
jgi:putative membrane protein